MRRLALLAVSACNWALGVHHTKLEQRDAPVDAPFTCPASGPPTYSHELHQVLDIGCWSFTFSASADMAAAACAGSDVGSPSDSVVYVGPFDSLQSWSFVAGAVGRYQDVLLTPDGDEIWTFDFNYNTMIGSFTVLGRDSGWMPIASPTLPFPYIYGDGISGPTKRPDRRMLYYRMFDSQWHELRETTPGVWADERTHPEIGPMLNDPRLSADGLRLSGWGYGGAGGAQTTMFTSRTNPAGGDFAMAVPIPTVPAGATYPFLTDDCGRVYFSGLSSVFYAQQP